MNKGIRIGYASPLFYAKKMTGSLWLMVQSGTGHSCIMCVSLYVSTVRLVVSCLLLDAHGSLCEEDNEQDVCND